MILKVSAVLVPQAGQFREEKFREGDRYYIVKEDAATPESKKLQFLQVLRRHEAYLATRLEQFQVRARTEENPEDSARSQIIRQRIEDFQSKLQEIKERREKVEKEESV